MLMVLIRTKDDTLNRYIRVQHHSGKRRKIKLRIKTLRQHKPFISFFYIDYTVESIEANAFIIDTLSKQIPSFLKHLQAIWSYQKSKGIGVLEILMSNVYYPTFPHGFYDSREEVTPGRYLFYQNPVF